MNYSLSGNHMKVYYFASQTNKEAIKGLQQRIKRVLEQSGVVVISNLNYSGETISSVIEQAEEMGQSVLSQMDALVIEGSGEDPEIGYLLAYAISTKIPTLYLSEKNSRIKNPLKFISRDKIPNNITTKVYGLNNVESILRDNLSFLEDNEYSEAPTIKFTLRVTPLIEQYLHWKTHNTNLTKADYLRQLLIEEVIKKDKHYKKYRHQKK